MASMRPPPMSMSTAPGTLADIHPSRVRWKFFAVFKMKSISNLANHWARLDSIHSLGFVGQERHWVDGPR